jgi:hypothetical protein
MNTWNYSEKERHTKHHEETGGGGGCLPALLVIIVISVIAPPIIELTMDFYAQVLCNKLQKACDVPKIINWKPAV